MDLVINLYKEVGISSNDALIKVKKIFKSRKAGHGGTLDPLAEGVLIIGLNNATKIFPYISDLKKEYIFTAQLGITTTTYDKEGTIVEQKDPSKITEQKVIDILPSFLGEIRQYAPIYSALKYRGKPLYEYARKGVAVDSKERTVNVYKIELKSFESPFFTMFVECSTGTYIRSICHDIGVMLGVGAHITMLKRTRVGHFLIGDSVRIDELPSSAKGIYNIEQSLINLPYVQLSNELIKLAKNGTTIKLDMTKFIKNGDSMKNRHIRLLNERFETFAIGDIKGDSIKIKRVLS
ncbi:MAG: tRNA pseudouridine(55) synthase TruB [Thermodesulfovibrionales bacterium]|nr:tRNA pseudouridine(55) synthase TruB [Thermodesulfovibrionales bacterium]